MCSPTCTPTTTIHSTTRQVRTSLPGSHSARVAWLLNAETATADVVMVADRGQLGSSMIRWGSLPTLCRTYMSKW
jgi:hypothetical protein